MVQLGGLPPSSALPPTLPTFSLGGLPPVIPVPASTVPAVMSTNATMSTPGKAPSILVATLPQKLVKKILDLEYIDMAELIPDAWRFQDEEGTKCCHRSRRQGRRGPVCDILLWIDCYSTMVQVLLTRFPDKAYELVSYQRTIIAAERDYEDEAWVTYDTCFRRQAAARKDLNWSQIDFTLYNQSFAGRAKSKSRCRHCLSEFHRSAVCDYAPESPPPPKRLPQGRGIPSVWKAGTSKRQNYAGSSMAHWGIHADSSPASTAMLVKYAGAHILR